MSIERRLEKLETTYYTKDDQRMIDEASGLLGTLIEDARTEGHRTEEERQKDWDRFYLLNEEITKKCNVNT